MYQSVLFTMPVVSWRFVSLLDVVSSCAELEWNGKETTANQLKPAAVWS